MRRFPVTHHRYHSSGLLLIAVGLLFSGPSTASGQQDNPVYVDDSPRAWELFLMARDQATDNVGEAVRLYQELLDDYGEKLLPVTQTTPDHFVAVRARVLTELSGNPALLERYRITETAEAGRLLDRGRLRQLAQTRPLTEPGLDALLCLAQDDLESARFYATLDRLRLAQRHPDLDTRRAAHCWYMIGAAASYLGLAEQYSAALEMLETLGPNGHRLRGGLEDVARASRPELHNGISSLDEAGATEIDDLVAEPIWSLPMPQTPLSRRLGDPMSSEPPSRRHVETLRRSGALLTTVATVAGSRIYINEGRIVHALERFTGRAVWPAFIERTTPSALEKSSRQIADLNVVAVREGSIVTITGHAYADTTRSDRTVVCLDADTGRQRWARRIDRLSPSDELDLLFPHGAPVIGEGMVYVLARKVSRQLLTSCYVIALDLDDGMLRWSRHVASSGGIRSRYARPFSTPVLRDGDIAVATAIGAVARFDATTGQTRWLRRYNPPLSPYLADRRPWEISGPVIMGRGVLALRPDHHEVIMLDWETGDDIAAAPSTGRDNWNSPRYLLANDDTVFGIGSEIRAYRDASLKLPLWTFPRQSPDPDTKPLYDRDNVELRGRVQVVKGGLIVPTADGVLLLDAETGDVTNRIDTRTVGNPLAAGPQLILAAADKLQGYMPLGRAEQMLRRQIAANPADPSPALALMRLGLRVRDLAMALEVADLAIRAINGATGSRSQVARNELFEILLELDREGVAETGDEGEALHAMIGVVANTPLQRVEHLLAYGDWLSAHALGRAVEAYQAILSSSALQDTPRLHDGIVRLSSAWAATRLATLIETHGAGVYRPQADFARDRLARLGPDADPEALLSLAREFPFADASIEAARVSAVRYAADGDHRAAVAVLTEVWMVAPVRDRAKGLLGPLVSLSVEAGWSEHARQVVQYAVTTFGRISLAAGSGDRDAATWLADLGAGVGSLPRVGDTGEAASSRDDTVVPPLPGAAVTLPADRVLVYDAPQLTLLSAPDLEPVWSTVLAVLGAPAILRFDDEALLLWVDMPGDEPRAVMLDPLDGSQRWVTTGFGALLHESLRTTLTNDLLPRGQNFDPTQTIPLVGRDTLILVRRSGKVMAVELADGNTPRWQRVESGVLRQVHLAVLGDTCLVLAGKQQAADGRGLVPRITVLDPDTGRTLSELTPLGGTAVTWMTIGPLGSLVYATAGGIESIDPQTGRRWWSIVGPDTKGSTRGWSAVGQIVVELATSRPPDGVNPIRALAAGDGQLSHPFDTLQRGEWDRFDLRAILATGGRLFARYGQRIVRFSPSGKLVGADVISEPRDYKWLLPAGDRLLVVSRHKSKPDPGDMRRTHQIYRVYALSDNCRLIGEVLELPPMAEPLEHAALVDGWLLLSTATGSVAVPMPVAPGSR